MAGDSNILSWLQRDGWPADFYDLLGRQRFDPDADAMREQVNAAAREIFPFQTHADPQTAARAMRLLTEFLGHAAGVLANDEKLTAEEDRIHDELRAQFAARHGDEPGKWDRTQLKSWLQREANVHPDNLESTLESLLPGGKKVERRRVFTTQSAPVEPILLEAMAPILLDEPPPQQSAVAPILVAEEVKPAAPGPRAKGRPAGARPGQRGKARANRKQAPRGRSSSSVPRAVAPAQTRRPPAPVPAQPVLEDDPPRGPDRRKIAFLITCLVGVPAACLVAVLLWLYGRNRSEAGAADETVKTLPVAGGKSGDGGLAVKSQPPETTRQPDVATQRRQKYVASMNQAKQTRGRRRAEHVAEALKFARDARQKADAYELLGRDPAALRTVDDFDRVSEAVSVLAQDAHFARYIGPFAEQLATERDVQRLLNTWLRKLEARFRDDAAAAVVEAILGSAAIEKLSLKAAVVVFERAGKAAASRRRSFGVQFVRMLRKRRALPGVLSDFAKKLSVPRPDETTLDYAVAMLEALKRDTLSAGQIARDDVFDVSAAVVRSTKDDLKRRTELAHLLSYAKKQNAGKALQAYCRRRLRTDAKDVFAVAVLKAMAEERLQQSVGKQGREAVALVDEALALAPTADEKAAVLGKAMRNPGYAEFVDFEKGRSAYETLIRARLGDKSSAGGRKLQSDLENFVKFVDRRGKVDSATKAYTKRRETDPRDAVAQQVCNALAAHHVGKVKSKYSGTAVWTPADINTIEDHLEIADAAARAEQLRLLLTDRQFKRGLSFTRYLRLQEAVVDGSEGFGRTSQIGTLVAVLTTDASVQLKVPIQKPSVRELQAYRIAQAVKFYANRLKTRDGKRKARLEMLRGLLEARSEKLLYLRVKGKSSIDQRDADRLSIRQIDAELQKSTGAKTGNSS